MFANIGFECQFIISRVSESSADVNMGKERLDNAAPTIYQKKSRENRSTAKEGEADPIDVQEVFDYIRDINVRDL